MMMHSLNDNGNCTKIPQPSSLFFPLQIMASLSFPLLSYIYSHFAFKEYTTKKPPSCVSLMNL